MQLAMTSESPRATTDARRVEGFQSEAFRAAIEPRIKPEVAALETQTVESIHSVTTEIAEIEAMRAELDRRLGSSTEQLEAMRRTVAEVRHALSKHGGNLGTEGSVAFQFKHCGQLIFAPGTDEDHVMELALDAGAEDVVTDDEGAIEVLCAPGDFEAVKAALEAAGLIAEMAEITMRADNTIDIAGDDAAKMQKLLDALEDLDDVQDVFHNAALELS